MKTITYQPKYSDKPLTLGVELFEYTNGGTCIDLIDMKDGETFMCATVWVEGLKDNEVAIKNYSENEGILQVLIDAKIISEPKRVVRSGFVVIHVCDLMSIDVNN
jgi:hypothetical protein